jgi:hypothetical protein
MAVSRGSGHGCVRDAFVHRLGGGEDFVLSARHGIVTQFCRASVNPGLAAGERCPLFPAEHACRKVELGMNIANDH